MSSIAALFLRPAAPIRVQAASINTTLLRDYYWGGEFPQPAPLPTMPQPPAPKLTNVSFNYARLLASEPRNCFELRTDEPIALYAQHLRHLSHEHSSSSYGAEFLHAAEALEFAAQLFNATGNTLYYPWCRTGDIAAQIQQHILNHDLTVIPCDVPDHAMLMGFFKDYDAAGNASETYSLRIFNTGLGIQKHHPRRARGKYQSVFEVRGVRVGEGESCINVPELNRLIRTSVKHLWVRTALTSYHRRDANWGIARVYQWARRKGEPYNPPSGKIHSAQKSGNCTHKRIAAFLKSIMSDVAYAMARTTLLETVFESLPTSRNADFRERLQAKCVRARLKLSKAQRIAEELEALKDTPWFFRNNDRAGSMQQLQIHFHRTQKARFCLIYAADIRRFNLLVAGPTGSACVQIGYNDETRQFSFKLSDGKIISFGQFQELIKRMRKIGFYPVH